MTEATKPSSVKLFIGAIFANEDIALKAKDALAHKFGPIDFESAVMKFDFTDYYEKEMGKGLRRQFFSFRKAISPERIVKIKLFTNRLEQYFAQESSRSINLDPGYLSAAKVVLASCKNYYHRIYLGSGVYAELAMYFQHGEFCFFPWTYPDYKSPEYLDAFLAIRKLYL